VLISLISLIWLISVIESACFAFCVSNRAAPRQLRSAQVSLIGACVQPVVLLSLQFIVIVHFISCAPCPSAFC
jgi:hypothetical protein